MKIILKEDPDPDLEFYYKQQFEIYREPYLLWDRKTWREVLRSCTVYRIEVDGNYAGDLIIQQRKAAAYIIDFGLLPEYRGKGVGKEALNKAKEMAGRLLAVTRKETLGFFLRSGFILRRVLRDYYDPGVDGYLITFPIGPGRENSR